MKAHLTGLLVCALTFACGIDERGYQVGGTYGVRLALTNSEGELGVLRTGTTLQVAATEGLKPNARYRIEVTNLRTGSVIAQDDVLTSAVGELERTAIAHDLGEFDGAKDSDMLRVLMTDVNTRSVSDIEIPLTPRPDTVSGHGFQVDEVPSAHVFSADSQGRPTNSYVVGALPDAGEVAGPVYIDGDGFPPNAAAVDIYVVRDKDQWNGQALPNGGDPNYIAGPVRGTVEGGVLKPTSVGWLPAGANLGPFELLVDVNRDGRYGYTFATKDASDDEYKVGLTVQTLAGTLQEGCTNSPPAKPGDPGQLAPGGAGGGTTPSAGGGGLQVLKYDIVLDYDKDNYYTIGVDALDVVAHRTDGGVVNFSEIEKLNDDEIFGLQVAPR